MEEHFVDEELKRIDDYFKNISDEKLLKQLIECGLEEEEVK